MARGERTWQRTFSGTFGTGGPLREATLWPKMPLDGPAFNTPLQEQPALKDKSGLVCLMIKYKTFPYHLRLSLRNFVFKWATWLKWRHKSAKNLCLLTSLLSKKGRLSFFFASLSFRPCVPIFLSVPHQKYDQKHKNHLVGSKFGTKYNVGWHRILF